MYAGSGFFSTIIWIMVPRWLWNLVGFVLVGVGLVGVFVPGLPTTVFLILALASFTKGANDRQIAWLLNHPRFGPVLRDWRENQWITGRVKTIAVSSIVVFSGLSIVMLRPVWTRKPSLLVIPATIGVAALGGVAYILTRRTKPSTSAGPTAEFRVDEAPGQVLTLATCEADAAASGDSATFGGRDKANRTVGV